MEKKSWNIYERRRETLKKKASSLSSLCHVDVCFLCFGPAGDFSSWPEKSSELRSAIEKFKRASEKSVNNNKRLKRKENLGLCDILGSKIKALRKQLEEDPEDPETNGSLSLPLWDEDLALLSKESLQGLFGCLASKLRAVEDRIGFLKARESSQGMLLNGCFSSGVNKVNDCFSEPNQGFFGDCYSVPNQVFRGPGIDQVQSFSEPHQGSFGDCYSVPNQAFLGPGIDQVQNFPEPFDQRFDNKFTPLMNNFGHTLEY